MATIVDLGQVSAVLKSSTPPTNHDLLWIDTNITSGFRIKYFDIFDSTWKLLDSGSEVIAERLKTCFYKSISNNSLFVTANIDISDLYIIAIYKNGIRRIITTNPSPTTREVYLNTTNNRFIFDIPFVNGDTIDIDYYNVAILELEESASFTYTLPLTLS